MNPTFQTIRAVGAEFATRLWLPVTIVMAIIFMLLIALSVWLTSLSAWWWLLFALVILWLLIIGFFLLVSRLIIATVSPRQTKAQKKQVKSFVDKLQRVSEVAQTPWPILLFRAVRDIARPREDSYIGSVTHDSTTLRRDFQDLTDSFR